jgi:hypothetical protein
MDEVFEAVFFDGFRGSRDVAGRTWPIRLGCFIQPTIEGMWVSTDSKATSTLEEVEGAVEEACEQVGEILDYSEA